MKKGGTNMRATGEKPDPVGPLGMAGKRSTENIIEAVGGAKNIGGADPDGHSHCRPEATPVVKVRPESTEPCPVDTGYSAECLECGRFSECRFSGAAQRRSEAMPQGSCMVRGCPNKHESGWLFCASCLDDVRPGWRGEPPVSVPFAGGTLTVTPAAKHDPTLEADDGNEAQWQALYEAARDMHAAFLKIDHRTLAKTMNRQWVCLDFALRAIEQRSAAATPGDPTFDVIDEYKAELDAEIEAATKQRANLVAQAGMDKRVAVCEVERRIAQRRAAATPPPPEDRCDHEFSGESYLGCNGPQCRRLREAAEKRRTSARPGCGT